ncbi:MAG: hypothetical protein NTV32_04885 [Gammaproteobacteria bacterium]|nr:hypothetical protein [Gammaproteobacteria bacterium]
MDVAQCCGGLILHVIVANFGNDSLALIAHAHAQKWLNVRVVSVDTGFANPAWSARVVQAEAYAREQGFEVIRLQAKPDFAGLVRAQGEFPTPKFQWCAVYLKGDTIRNWLEINDPLKTAKVILARRRSQSLKFEDLPEWIENDEAFSGRLIWHPFYLYSESEIKALVAATPFEWLPHRSLECDPCVNSSCAELKRAIPDVQSRIQVLEAEIGGAFLKKNIPDKPFIFDMGCGSPYGCGL